MVAGVASYTTAASTFDESHGLVFAEKGFGTLCFSYSCKGLQVFLVLVLGYVLPAWGLKCGREGACSG